LALDDDRLAKASRLLRREKRLRQTDMVAAGRSRGFVIKLESGALSDLRVGDVRNHFAALGASVRLNVWWNGAALDRLLDERHAAVVDVLIGQLARYGWRSEAELSFSEFGERGSIDVFAAHAASRMACVCEAKSEWGSIEETLRRLSVKIRLAPKLCRDTFGFSPRSVGAVLAFPEDRTARRIAARHSATIGQAFPARGHEIREWLRRPAGPLRGLWFLSNVDPIRPSRPARR